MKRIFLLFLVVFFCSFSLTAEPPKQLNVGAVLSLTGMASAHGTAIKDGIEFAKTHLAAKGWDIHIAYDDDGSEPKRTVVSYQKFTSENLRFFIGPTWDILATAVVPIVSRTKSLCLQPCNSSDFRAGNNERYFFLFTPPSSSQKVLNDFMRRFKGKKVAILNNTSPWGILWEQLFKNAISDAGAIYVRSDLIQFSENNLVIPTLMTRYKQDGIEVILSTTTKESNATIVTSLEKLQTKMVFLSPDLVDSMAEKLLPNTSKFVEGYTVTPITSKEFSAEFKNKYGYEPKKYTDSGYDSLMALAIAVENVGTDPDKVKEYLEMKLDMEGAAGRIKFNPKHDIQGRGYEVSKLVSLE